MPSVELEFQVTSSLSKKPGSFSILRSNLVHQSWKLFNGTTSWPPAVVVPAKLARKLKAFLMMRWAKAFVDSGIDCGRLSPVEIMAVVAVDDSKVEAFSDSSWDTISAAGSIAIPTVMSPAVATVASLSVVEDTSTSVISSSLEFQALFEGAE